jgi:phosphopantothenoylcysteine decarboxylase/phosphopantothenate--cysteine ligase
MARILITSGPTREYLDPVRFLTNGSSGQMGAALAQAALSRGHPVTIVSGPVSITYPSAARVIWVISTREMLDACLAEFGACAGAIGAAAPCDVRPKNLAEQKLPKESIGDSLALEPTPDVIAALGRRKANGQWTVGFALETDRGRERARAKLATKQCDWIILNNQHSIDSEQTEIEILDSERTLLQVNGSKASVADMIFEQIDRRLIAPAVQNVLDSR